MPVPSVDIPAPLPGKNEKIALAMSGGVDSTAAALLLQDQGYAVQGFFMDLPLPDRKARVQWVKDLADALGIPLKVVDLRERFRSEVLLPFVRSYQSGQTPNPCCRCNPLLKFGALAQTVRDLGLPLLATGHYARLGRISGQKVLLRSLYQEKDQSYFLAGLSAAQLESTLFPLGELSKEQAYQRAEAAGFSFRGKESQDICFLPHDQSLPSFLQEKGLSKAQGELLTIDGCCLGSHQGTWNYTIGQRRGLSLPDATPWYVVSLDSQRNQVIIGKERHLWQQDCLLRDLHWIYDSPALPWQGLVQLRSRHKAAEALLESLDPKQPNLKKFRLRFAQEQRAITPGQFAVFYEGERVLGCAVIEAPPCSAALP